MARTPTALDRIALLTARGQTLITGSDRILRGEKPADKPTLGDPRPETYEIVSADHERDDFWIVRARIQFAENDIKLPVRVRVVWAEDTPVITVDEVSIPGIGVYTARVMILTSVLCGDGAADDSGFFRSSAVVDETNAIVFPVGDQTGPLAPRGRSVTARASPPSSGNK